MTASGKLEAFSPQVHLPLTGCMQVNGSMWGFIPLGCVCHTVVTASFSWQRLQTQILDLFLYMTII